MKFAQGFTIHPGYFSLNLLHDITSRTYIEISKLCDAHKVKRLYAVGSILTDKFNEHSDVDFIVEFN